MIVDLSNLIQLIRDAGRLALEIYESEDYVVEQKSDLTPVTLADKRVNEFLLTHLSELYPQSNFITEESLVVDYADRKEWEYAWIIDPLDGTKEFINRNGEFTINIALARYGEVIFGMVMVPVLDVIYYAEKNNGAFKIQDGLTTSIQSVKPISSSLIVLTSRSHRNKNVEEFVSKVYPEFSEIAYNPVGSSLKICLIADGGAHFYPRLGPTMEWDVAAGIIIAEEAGAIVESIDGQRLMFNKEDLKNPPFLVRSF